MTHSSPSAPDKSAFLGWFGFALGALALVLVVSHFFSGPFAPQHSAGVTVGELAAEMRDSALRSLRGEAQPAPIAVPWDIDDWLRLAGGILGAGSVVLAVASFVRREPYGVGVGAMVLGGGAIAFQFFAMTVMMLIGIFLVLGIAKLVFQDWMPDFLS